jgi:hypothetical protein
MQITGLLEHLKPCGFDAGFCPSVTCPSPKKELAIHPHAMIGQGCGNIRAVKRTTSSVKGVGGIPIGLATMLSMGAAN